MEKDQLTALCEGLGLGTYDELKEILPEDFKGIGEIILNQIENLVTMNAALEKQISELKADVSKLTGDDTKWLMSKDLTFPPTDH